MTTYQATLEAIRAHRPMVLIGHPDPFLVHAWLAAQSR